jgi:hypothetical protein
MLKETISFLFCLISLIGCTSPKSSVGYEPEIVRLTGVIERRVFPGPPNYEDVSKGDEAEVYWILKFHDLCGQSFPIIVQGDDSAKDGLNVTEQNVHEFQLVLSSEQYEKYKHLLNRQVQVTGTLLHQHTGHHHLPVLVKVEKMEPFPEIPKSKPKTAD